MPRLLHGVVAEGDQTEAEKAARQPSAPPLVLHSRWPKSRVTLISCPPNNRACARRRRGPRRRPREDLVRHHLVLALRETSFKSIFPRQTQFRIDVNDIDPGVDRPSQIYGPCRNRHAE